MVHLTPRDRAALTRALERARSGSAAAARDLYYALRGKTAKEVLAILDEVGADFAKALAAEVSEKILAAQGIGGRAAADTAIRLLRRHRLPPDMAERAESWLRKRIADASYRVSPLTGARTAVVSPEGTVWLSRALHGGNREGVIDGLRRAITTAVREGETASSLAQRLRDEVGHRVAVLDSGPSVLRVPPQLREMEQAALRSIRASGDPRIGADLRRIRGEFAAYRDGLTGGKYGSRSAARAAFADIERAVARGSEEAVEKAIKWYCWNREQDHQRTIAQTETARAYNQAYISGSRAVPWVKGWIWVADGESCEECMALDGTFIPRDAPGPFPPAHPHCDCHIEEEIDPDVEPSEAEWSELLSEAA